MIAKISKGAGFNGVFKYILQKSGAQILGGNAAGKDPVSLAAEFDTIAEMRPSISKPVYHISMAVPIGERLTADAWRKIVPMYLAEMEIPAQDHQFIFAEHVDTKHQHIHLVINRISLDGAPFKADFERYRNKDACRAIEDYFKLTKVPNEKKPNAPRHTQGERRYLQRTGADDGKSFINAKIAAAVVGKPSIQELTATLAADGISIKPNLATTGKLSGFSFSHAGKAYTGAAVGYAWKYLEPAIQPLNGDDMVFLQRLKAGENPEPKKRPRDPGAYGEAWKAFNSALFATATGKGKASNLKEALESKGYALDAGIMEKNGQSFELAGFGYTKEIEDELFDLKLMNEKARRKSQEEARALVKKYHGKGFDLLGKIEGETLVLMLAVAPQLFLATILFQIAVNAIAESRKPASEEELRTQIRTIYEKNGDKLKEEMNALYANLKEERRLQKEAKKKEAVSDKIIITQEPVLKKEVISDKKIITQKPEPVPKKKESSPPRLKRALNGIFYNDRRFLQMEKEGLPPAKIAAALFKEFIPKDAQETLRRAGWPEAAVSAACERRLKAIDLESMLNPDPDGIIL